MSVNPSVESLRLAVELIKAGKFSDSKVLHVAAIFDGYLSGAFAAKISFDADGRPTVEINPSEPEQSAGDDRTASTVTSDSELKRSDFVEGPAGDRDYQIELACDRLMRLLPQKALELVNSGAFPAGLDAVINSSALAELERRDALKEEEKS